DLVAQTIGANHQYPDGFMLFLGTMFAPTKDRGVKGEGFTHKTGDRVSISSADIGLLHNQMKLSADCQPWTFGLADLMRNLSARGLV
ncbi:MAG: fumarylacetoacetate hydrolase, partial [Alphaproteobacteria bacterium]